MIAVNPSLGQRTFLRWGWLGCLLALGCSSEAAPFFPAPVDAGLDSGPLDPCRGVADIAHDVTPQVMFVLDRSGSMLEQSRWSSATSAIEAVTAELDARIRFGLTFFPGMSRTNPCAPGRIEIEPAVNAGNRIAFYLGQAFPEGGTPTAATLRALRGSFVSPDDRSFVILITDGGPNCSSDLDPATCTSSDGRPVMDSLTCLDRDATVVAARQLRELGAPVYVLSMSSDFPTIFDAIAEAGGTEQAYPIGDPDQLLAVLRDIAARLASCELRLNEVFTDPEMIMVTIDGVSVPFVGDEGGDGWRFGGPGIELIGTACETLRDGRGHQVRAVRECTPI